MSIEKKERAGLVDLLRAATAGIHREIEETPFVQKLSARDLPAECILDQLRSFAVVHCALEKVLADSRDARVREVAGAHCSRDVALSEDLEKWNRGGLLGDNEEAVGKARGFADEILLLGETAPVAVLGVLYVIEGTGLGNRVHLGDVEACLRDAPFSTAYYSGEGETTGEAWNRFRAALAGVEVMPEEAEVVVGAAVSAFRWCEAILRAIYPLQNQRIFLATTFNPEAGNHPVPQSLDLLNAALAASEKCLVEHPYFLFRFGERGRRFARSDALWLAGLLFFDIGLLRGQVKWLTGFLACKGMPSLLMECMLERLAEELPELGGKRQEASEKLRLLAGELREARGGVVCEKRGEELVAAFERAACRGESGIKNAAWLLIAAYADEAGGIEGAYCGVRAFFEDAKKFGEDWVKAVRKLDGELKGDKK